MFLLSVNENDNDGDDNGDCDNDGIMSMTTDILPPGEPVIRRPGPDAALEVDVVPLQKVVHQDGHDVYQDGHVVYQDGHVVHQDGHRVAHQDDHVVYQNGHDEEVGGGV